MDRNVYRVLPDDGGWVVQLDGVDLSRHQDKDPAVARARALAELARPSQVVVHYDDGTIEAEWAHDKNLDTEGDPDPRELDPNEMCECGHTRVRHKGIWPNEEKWAGRCNGCRRAGRRCDRFKSSAL